MITLPLLFALAFGDAYINWGSGFYSGPTFMYTVVRW